MTLDLVLHRPKSGVAPCSISHIFARVSLPNNCQRIVEQSAINASGYHILARSDDAGSKPREKCQLNVLRSKSAS
jgi:hypothetical protein